MHERGTSKCLCTEKGSDGLLSRRRFCEICAADDVINPTVSVADHARQVRTWHIITSPQQRAMQGTC